MCKVWQKSTAPLLRYEKSLLNPEAPEASGACLLNLAVEGGGAQEGEALAPAEALAKGLLLSVVEGVREGEGVPAPVGGGGVGKPVCEGVAEPVGEGVEAPLGGGSGVPDAEAPGSGGGGGSGLPVQLPVGVALGVSAPVGVALAIGEGVALPVGVGGGVGGSVGGGAQEGSSEGEPLPDPVHEGVAERLAVGKAHAAAASRAPRNSRRDVRVRRHAARRSLATAQARQRKGGGARTKRRTVDLTASATKPRRSRSCTRAAARRAPRREEAKRPHGKAQARSMGGNARKSRCTRASMKIPVIDISSTAGRGAPWSAENGAHLTIHAIQLPCATVRARRRRPARRRPRADKFEMFRPLV
jgi:hypothetical protein